MLSNPDSQTPEFEADREIGDGWYVVQPGECVLTISERLGYHWETIWNDPNNAELKKVREDPTVLRTGDRVYIPRKRPRIDSVRSKAKQKFVRRGIPAMVRVQICDEGKPLFNKEFELDVNGEVKTGMTDSNGYVEVPVPSAAKRVTLTVGEGEDVLELELVLGGLDPVDTVKGLQARLANLGFDPGPVDGRFGPSCQEALRQFQKETGLEETEVLDDETKQKLLSMHGS